MLRPKKYKKKFNNILSTRFLSYFKNIASLVHIFLILLLPEIHDWLGAIKLWESVYLMLGSQEYGQKENRKN